MRTWSPHDPEVLRDFRSSAMPADGSTDALFATVYARRKGKWADIGKFKCPIPRGLSARAPYVRNGSVARSGDVVDFHAALEYPHHSAAKNRTWWPSCRRGEVPIPDQR